MAKKVVAAKAESPATEIAGINLSEAREGILDASIAKIEGVKFNAEATLAEKVEFLEMHNRRSIPKGKALRCEVCGAHSHEDETSCPVCGDGIDAEVEAVEEVEVGDVVPAGPDEDEVEADEAPVPAKAVKAERSKKIALVKPSAAILKPASALGELDQINARIDELKRQGARNYWQIGQEIHRVFEGQLWKARVAKGKSAYKSFEQYVTAEVGFSAPQAYAMMDVASKYSEVLIAKVGFTKLSIVLTAPPEVQGDILEEVEKGMSKRELLGKVQAERRKPGAKLPKTGRKGTGKSPGRPKKAAGDGRMTVAATEGTKKIPLFVKPTAKLAPGEMPEKRAKKLSDEPFAIEQLDNGVVRYYTIVNSATGLALKIDTKRAK